MPKFPQLRHKLPTRKIAYHYTAAMHFAQRFEQDLRAILYTADYHGWIDEMVSSAAEQQRFKDFDGFIDKSACGLVLQKLRRSGVLKDGKALISFNKAIELRNMLAHSFLTEHQYEDLDQEAETEVVRSLQRAAIDLAKAMVVSGTLREKLEAYSDEQHERLRELVSELAGMENYQNPDLKFSTRRRKLSGK